MDKLIKAIECLKINKGCCELDKLNGTACKDIDDFIESYELAIEALEEKYERENPEPLEVEQLLHEMYYKDVYIQNMNAKNTDLRHVLIGSLTGAGNIRIYEFGENRPITRGVSTYGKTWIAYKYKPSLKGEA